MTETGTVTKVKGNRVTVNVSRRAECSSCGMCGMKDHDTGMDFVAVLPEEFKNVQVGQMVTIKTYKDLRILSYLLIFLVPLLLVGASLAVGLIFLNELWTVFIAVCSVALWYGLLSFIDKRISFLKGASYTVTAILEKGVTNE